MTETSSSLSPLLTSPPQNVQSNYAGDDCSCQRVLHNKPKQTEKKLKNRDETRGEIKSVRLLSPSFTCFW